MTENEKQGALQSMISCISTHFWSITSVWIDNLEVSNYHSRLQPKKLSRTRDIWNFPTKGWADTAFYTSYWIRTYKIADLPMSS